MKLKELFELVKKNWVFDSTRYGTLLRGKTSEYNRWFAIRHILLHISKSHGVICGIAERGDHGESSVNSVVNSSRVELIEAIREQFVNLSQLATECCISSEEIENSVVQWVKAQKAKT